MSTLDPLLRPRSIALIGASSDEAKFGGRPLAALLRFGYGGRLHAVNPHRSEIKGIPCAKSVEDLPEGLDLAVIALPADAAIEALHSCALRGFRAACLLSGGFSEAGTEGAGRQRRLLQILKGSQMRLLGPNTPGFVNVRDRVACSASAFTQREEMFPGKIAFAVQSGAVAGILVDRAMDRGIGVNLVVCTGNEVDVGVAEVVALAAEDEQTRAIGLFLEGLGGDRRLAEALRAARERGLGIAVMKAGRSEQGRRIVASHTANIVGSEGSFNALCKSLGIVRAYGYDDLIEATQLLATTKGAGRRVAVVGSSGGMNTLLADAAGDRGIELPTLSEQTVAKIAQLTPDFGSASNPVDISSVILVEPERMGQALSHLSEDESIETVIVAIGDHPPALSSRFASILTDSAQKAKTPILVQWSAGPLSFGGIAALGRASLPVLTEPERLMWALDATTLANDRPRAPQRAGATMNICDAAKAIAGATTTTTQVAAAAAGAQERANAAEGAESGVQQGPDQARGISESEAKGLLAAVGIRVPRGALLGEHDDVGALVAELGGTAVLKADCIGPVHKSELGAVALGVSAAEAEAVAERVRSAAVQALGAERVLGVLAEEMVEPIAELIVSVNDDPQVGPVITVGLGGQLVEVLADTSSRLAPVDEAEALAMLGELKGAAILKGVRGRPAADTRAGARLISAISRLAIDSSPHLQLLECNPVALLEDGALVLDAVIELR